MEKNFEIAKAHNQGKQIEYLIEPLRLHGVGYGRKWIPALHLNRFGFFWDKYEYRISPESEYDSEIYTINDESITEPEFESQEEAERWSSYQWHKAYKELQEELGLWQKRALEAEAEKEKYLSGVEVCEIAKLKRDLAIVKAREQEYRTKWRALKEKFQFFENVFHGIAESDEL